MTGKDQKALLKEIFGESFFEDCARARASKISKRLWRDGYMDVRRKSVKQVERKLKSIREGRQ